MSRKLISAVLCGGLLALTAYGQQPGLPPQPVIKPSQPAQPSQPPKVPQGSQAQPGQPFLPQQPSVPGQPKALQPAQPKVPGGPTVPPGTAKYADPADAQVQAALAHDPDVKMAQAKIQLAEAELAKAKQAVVLKVMTLNATIKELKAAVDVAEATLANDTALLNTAAVSSTIILQDRAKLEQARNALGKAEMELKLLTGGDQKDLMRWRSTTIDLTGALPAPEQLRWFQADASADKATKLVWELTDQLELARARAVHDLVYPISKGPMAERIRALLDKPVKLAPKGEKVTFEKALEAFKKEAGFDVPVRNNWSFNPITSEGEELPVGAWFQLFADEDLRRTSPSGPGPRFLVREYGILVTSKEHAPPDAMTLGELWKQPVKKDGETKAKEPAKK